MIVLILVVLGLIFGSFINAFVWRHYQQSELRYKRKELLEKSKKAKKNEFAAIDKQISELSISHGRSKCTHCGHELAAKDLIPVISFVWLRGKCRYCGKRIEDTPLAEILLPVLLVVSYLFWPLSFHGLDLVRFIFWLVFVAGFVVLILYDLRWFLLPHSIVLPLIGLAVIQLVVLLVSSRDWHAAVGSLAGALIIGGMFFVLYQVSDGNWIGGGDITLGVLLGLLVGGPIKAFAVVFIASLIGTVVAIPLLVSGKASRNTKLPFGPFLIIAGIIVVLFGSRLIDWYTGPFLNSINSLFM